MEAAGFYVMLVPLYQTLRRHAVEYSAVFTAFRPADPGGRTDRILKEINSVNIIMTLCFVRLPFKQIVSFTNFCCWQLSIVRSRSHIRLIELRIWVVTFITNKLM